MRRLLTGVLLATVACGSSEPPPSPGTIPSATLWLGQDVAGVEPSSFVVMAGHWIIHDEGRDRILRVDGTEWKPGTPPSSLLIKAMRLFPSQSLAFAERVKAGLQFPFGVEPSVETFADGEIQVDFRLIGGASDQFASILFGLNADADHYAFRYNTKDGDTALWKVVNGQRERIHHGGVHIDVPLNEWRTLKMRVRGAEITGWVNDTQALQFTLPAPVSGKVGLWSKADSVTDYRNYRVTPRR